MSLKNLADMRDFLEAQNLVDQHKFAAVFANGQLQPRGRDRGTGGFIIAHIRYTAEFFIDGFSGNPDVIFALVAAYLLDHGGDRGLDELPAPTIAVDELDNAAFDVVISVEFKEAITLIEDATGDIPFNAAKYRLSALTPDVAEVAGVTTDPAGTTDLAVGT